MKKHLLAAALVGLLAAGSASAATITQQDAFGAGYTLQTTNWTHTLSALNQFNSALGTLTAVNVTLEASMAQQIKAENKGDSPDLLTPLAGASVTFRQGTTNVLSTLLSETAPGFAATAWDGVDDFGGSSGTIFDLLTDSDTMSTTLSTPAQLAGFIGVGTLSAYNLRAVGSGTVDTENGNLLSEILTTARGRITLEYVYDPRQDVPEPASLALVGLALAGLAFTRRRKV